MSDLISRAAVIDAIMSVDDYTSTFVAYKLGSAITAVKTLPSADAVEVVRCKDCKWWRDTDHTCKEHSLVSPMGANEFCSRGERKDGKQNG